MRKYYKYNHEDSRSYYPQIAYIESNEGVLYYFPHGIPEVDKDCFNYITSEVEKGEFVEITEEEFNKRVKLYNEVMKELYKVIREYNQKFEDFLIEYEKI